MDTPICDFVRAYATSGTLRLHMPGHKGAGTLEALDITEIQGADSLYEAGGIIARSEANASRLFGCPTYYSTEGSSLGIRAMLYLCVLHAQGKRVKIAAGRNAHKVFLSAAALLDFEIQWIYPKKTDSYLSCTVDPAELEELLTDDITAVYLTSPDYLGNVADIRAISEVCHRHGCLLIVDNAHGAYLRFLPQSRHPMDLGADACCDSAHKTLPVLTGGAYLHVSPELDREVKNALALFGSTSPSYLILQSLDRANRYLEGYPERLAAFTGAVEAFKSRLGQYRFLGNEPLKLTIDAKAYGYYGTELADLLRQQGIECEFSDPDFLVLMVTPETGETGLRRLEAALDAITARDPIRERPPAFHAAEQVLSVRRAMFSPAETIPVEGSRGRILAAATVGCPPAVPILVCGEKIDDAAVSCFEYYGIESVCITAR